VGGRTGVGEKNYWQNVHLGRLNRRTLLAASSAAGAGLVLAACGRGQSSSATAPAAAKPKPGGALTTAQNVEASDFDPTGRPTVNRPLMCYAYDSLLSWKNGPGVPFSDVEVQPGLADSWESPDGLTYTFHLHMGARFQNLAPVNGRAVTSADAKWSVQYVSRTGTIKDDKKLFPGQYADSFTGLQDIQTPDDSTVIVRFEKPFAPYLNYAAAEWNPILAHEVYERDGNFSNLLLGTGPFQLDTSAVQKGTRYIYRKNPTYFRDGLPYVDQISELIIPDDSTALAAFQTKQVDILPSWAGSSLGPDRITRAVPDAQILEGLQKSFVMLTNMDKPPLNDARVRQALTLAIDRGELIKSMTGGKGQPALAGAVPGYYSADEVKQLVPYDPEKAKQLLAAAGFANGIDLELIEPTSKYGQAFVTEVQLIQSQVKKAGINLTLKPVSDTEDSMTKRAGTFQLDLDPNTTKAGDPDGCLYPLYNSTSTTTNYLRVRDPQLDALLEAQRREMDPAKRKDLVRQALKLINDNTYGIGMYDYPEYRAAQAWVKGYAASFPQLQDHHANTWLAK
jgi:peptide/nickel transport system substrate-binding protein